MKRQKAFITVPLGCACSTTFNCQLLKGMNLHFQRSSVCLTQLSDCSSVEGVLLKTARDEESKDEILPSASSYRPHFPIPDAEWYPQLGPELYLPMLCLQDSRYSWNKEKKAGNSSYLWPGMSFECGFFFFSNMHKKQ